MTVKELIDVLEHYPNQDHMVVVHSTNPFKLIAGVIAVEEVFLGREKLPVLYIGEKRDEN